jgi:hypothetical protein
VIATITCSLVVLTEIALRVFFPATPSVSRAPSEEQTAFEFNPVYLVALKKNQLRPYRKTGAHGPVVTYWQTDQNGFRAKASNGPHSIRIMVYGDSNIFARFSNFEDAYTQRVQAKLTSMTAQSIEVINAGVEGFGPDQSLLRFESEAAIYRPDIVVFHVFADNDFGDLIRNRLFSLDEAGRLVKTDHPRLPDQCLRITPCFTTENKRPSLREWAQSLRMTHGFRKILAIAGITLPKAADPTPDEIIDYYLDVTRAEYAVYKSNKPRTFSHFSDYYDLDVSLFPEWESSQTKIRLMETVLQKAYEVARANHIRFMLLIEPSSLDLTPNLKPNYADFSKFAAYSPKNLVGPIENIAAKHHIPFISLYDLFRANSSKGLYFDDGYDDHWNNAGQELAASATANFIRTQFLNDTGNKAVSPSFLRAAARR